MDPEGVARADAEVGEGECCKWEAVVGSRMGKLSDRPFAWRLAEAVVLFKSLSGLAGIDGAASEVVEKVDTGSSCNEMGRDLEAMIPGGGVQRCQSVFDRWWSGLFGRLWWRPSDRNDRTVSGADDVDDR